MRSIYTLFRSEIHDLIAVLVAAAQGASVAAKHAQEIQLKSVSQVINDTLTPTVIANATVQLLASSLAFANFSMLMIRKGFPSA